MSWTTYHNKPDPYLDEAYEVTAERIKVGEWLMDNTEWDLMASVWVSIDRTQHCLSNYCAPDHPDYAANKDSRIGNKVADIFRQADEAIGSFVSRARPDDIILFISDHGFQSCTRTINMDRMLKEFGYLDFSASNAVFGPMQWGPDAQGRAQGVRHARSAREGFAAAVGQLVEDQGVHHDPLDRRGRVGEPRRPRDRRDRRPGRLREGAERAAGPLGHLRGPQNRQEARQGDL